MVLMYKFINFNNTSTYDFKNVIKFTTLLKCGEIAIFNSFILYFCPFFAKRYKVTHWLNAIWIRAKLVSKPLAVTPTAKSRWHRDTVEAWSCYKSCITLFQVQQYEGKNVIELVTNLQRSARCCDVTAVRTKFCHVERRRRSLNYVFLRKLTFTRHNF